jgi:enoyl-CoA hydratase/carnithine racemase
VADQLTVTVDGHVAVIEINRPPANYFDRALIAQIAEAAAAVQAGGSRAIVLCSEGKHFCAGANFGTGEMAAGGQVAADRDMATDRKRAAQDLYREAVRIFQIAVPVIAAVQGSAVGGGLGLACAADFRVAAPSARFHANFSALGFHQGFGLSVTLPEIVGLQEAMDLLYASRRIDGQRALEIGLADRLVPDGTQRSEAIAWAAEIAERAPLAVRSMKQTLRAPLVQKIRAVLERELSEQARLWDTEDSKIGIAANLAREQPVFTGR